MELVWPSRVYLPSYVAALEQGWSPDNVRGDAAAREQLDWITRDADAFLASLVDREARSGPLTLLDGTVERVIVANSGVFVEQFVTPPALGSQREARYRVYLDH